MAFDDEGLARRALAANAFSVSKLQEMIPISDPERYFGGRGWRRDVTDDDKLVLYRQALATQIDRGPIPAIHGVVRWRLSDLGQWLWEEFRVSASKQTLSRELRAMGYRKLSARPRHYAQAEGAIEHFKKVSPPRWRASRGRRASAPRP